ncbi:MAG: glycosyltransferase family 4 protein [Acidimicrobiales bacterium]
MSIPERLRIAHLVYRGNPYSGGQGVYTHYLTRELAALGHEVTIFSGPPHPEIPEGVAFEPVRSLDLYAEPHPFRAPAPWEFKEALDFLEFGIMSTAGFPEPRTFSLRVERMLRTRRHHFDVIHDNQCLGSGVGRLIDRGWPIVGTIHHPITVDRDLDLAHAKGLLRRLTLRRWYGFIGMQVKVAKQLERVITVSESSRDGLVREMGVSNHRISIVPVGVDTELFKPQPERPKVPGRIMATTSSDVPMKGLVVLLDALAKVRVEHPDAHLVVIGRAKEGGVVADRIRQFGLTDAVRFVRGVETSDIVDLYAESQLAVVPSLYEGFSLPAIEAMASGVPLVATTGGALPEVVGTDNVAALTVPPGDAEAMAAAMKRVLDDSSLAARLAAEGRKRVLVRFTWRAAAEATVEEFRRVLERRC